MQPAPLTPSRTPVSNNRNVFKVKFEKEKIENNDPFFGGGTAQGKVPGLKLEPWKISARFGHLRRLRATWQSWQSWYSVSVGQEEEAGEKRAGVEQRSQVKPSPFRSGPLCSPGLTPKPYMEIAMKLLPPFSTSHEAFTRFTPPLSAQILPFSLINTIYSPTWTEVCDEYLCCRQFTGLEEVAEWVATRSRASTR